MPLLLQTVCECRKITYIHKLFVKGVADLAPETWLAKGNNVALFEISSAEFCVFRQDQHQGQRRCVFDVVPYLWIKGFAPEILG